MEEETTAAAEGGEREEFAPAEARDATLQDLIRQAVDEEVAGLKETNRKLKDEKRVLAGRLKPWEGLDADRVRSVMERLELDDEARMIAEGRVEEVLTRRGERLVREQADEIDTRDQKIAELEGQLQARDEQLARRVVDDQIRAAATGSGLIPSAVDDALFRGRQVFSLDEEGEAVARDESGAVLSGLNGSPCLTPAEWLEAMREIAPHWWPHSSGGGAPGAAASNAAVLGYDQAGLLNPERYVQLRREGRII